MNINEIRKMSAEDLQKEYESSLKEQFNLRMQKGLKQPVRPHQFQLLRRKIARILTVMHEKRKV
ncbi:MAG: 50S ribosomal protein L29 [Pseudomonadota bacterium]